MPGADDAGVQVPTLLGPARRRGPLLHGLDRRLGGHRGSRARGPARRTAAAPPTALLVVFAHEVKTSLTRTCRRRRGDRISTLPSTVRSAGRWLRGAARTSSCGKRVELSPGGRSSGGSGDRPGPRLVPGACRWGWELAPVALGWGCAPASRGRSVTCQARASWERTRRDAEAPVCRHPGPWPADHRHAGPVRVSGLVRVRGASVAGGGWRGLGSVDRRRHGFWGGPRPWPQPRAWSPRRVRGCQGAVPRRRYRVRTTRSRAAGRWSCL